MDKKVFLIGPRAAGKTTLGFFLAQETACPFVDADVDLQAALGKSVAEIVASESWEAFRKYESEFLQSIPPAPLVVATGGGIILSEANRNYLKSQGVVFYLKTTLEVLCERLMSDDNPDLRPRFSGKTLKEEVSEILVQREFFYKDTAHCVLNASLPIKTLSEQIQAFLIRKSKVL